MRHGRYLVFPLTEVLFARILRRIDGLRLRSPPFRLEGAGAMNHCHPTDKVRAFMIRVQPIATRRRLRTFKPRQRGFRRPMVPHRTLPIAVAWRTVFVRNRHLGNVGCRKVYRSSLL